MSAFHPVGSTVTNLDRLVSRIRLWLEDRLPWYDREAEEQAEAHTEAIRQRSIRVRKDNEAIVAAVRNTVSAVSGKGR